MKLIKYFEAFGDGSVATIDKFLKDLNIDDRKYFLFFLQKMCEQKDILLSELKGKYLNVKNAKKYNSDSEVIKIWLSLEDGIVGITSNKKYSESYYYIEQEWFDDFIRNNTPLNNYCRDAQWSRNSYYRIKDANFSLVIDLKDQEKGLYNKRKNYLEILINKSKNTIVNLRPLPPPS